MEQALSNCPKTANMSAADFSLCCSSSLYLGKSVTFRSLVGTETCSSGSCGCVPGFSESKVCGPWGCTPCFWSDRLARGEKGILERWVTSTYTIELSWALSKIETSLPVTVNASPNWDEVNRKRLSRLFEAGEAGRLAWLFEEEMFKSSSGFGFLSTYFVNGRQYLGSMCNKHHHIVNLWPTDFLVKNLTKETRREKLRF